MGAGDEQIELFKKRGGAREGAGRKRVAARPCTAHRSRERVSRHVPQHVTMRLKAGLPSLRGRKGRRAFVGACERGKERLGMRVVHWSVQRDHVHLIVEADGADALARGMTGLAVRFVRRLNRELGRKGPALGDRYHARALGSPREVREAVRYVLANARHHDDGPAAGARWIDAWSSGAWFDGWRDGRALARELARRLEAEGVARDGPPVAPARSWLLREGWTRAGLLSCEESPA